MKIVLVTHHFLPKFYGGTEQYTRRVAQGLRYQGHAPEIVCIESIARGALTPTCTTDTYEGLPVHRLHFDLGQAPHQLEWSFRNPELGQWFRRFLRRTCPDVVHVNSGYLLSGTVPEAALEMGIPTVLTLHDYWFMCPLITLLRTDGQICEWPVPPARCVWCSLLQKRRYRLLDKRILGRLGDVYVRLGQSRGIANVLGIAQCSRIIGERRRYLKQVLESVDLVISPSRFLIQKLGQYGLNTRRLVYLPFGVAQGKPFGSCRANLSRPSPNSSPDKLRIGYLGQFAPHKGVHLLLDAFQELAVPPGSCHMTLHGRISEASTYERKLLSIANRDPTITFVGPYPNSEVGQVLHDLDVIVVPSLWYENRPTVIIEAHAAKTPVVAARLGGMAELIRHNENGLLFEVGSVESLGEQLQRLVDEPALLSQLRRNILPVPTSEQDTAKLVSLYQSLSSAS